ncbi:Hypothetical predicted protein [Octopus vulgaris]|uniref:Uncharacterized protein n=1 Tax=Octopus vulgaris TaxID=6645 RepID=A0AA36AV95_OCTVU|nr:Hypothetical predicted protein [Octopus vulgaris]
MEVIRILYKYLKCHCFGATMVIDVALATDVTVTDGFATVAVSPSITVAAVNAVSVLRVDDVVSVLFCQRKQLDCKPFTENVDVENTNYYFASAIKRSVVHTNSFLKSLQRIDLDINDTKKVYDFPQVREQHVFRGNTATT